MGPSATLTKPMFVFVIEFQSFPFMLMRLVIGQYLLCKFCIPALFKPNFCDVSKIQKIQNFVWGPKSENLKFEYQRMGGWLQGTWWNPYTERYWLQTVNSSNIWKKYLNLYCSCGHGHGHGNPTLVLPELSSDFHPLSSPWDKFWIIVEWSIKGVSKQPLRQRILNHCWVITDHGPNS